MKNISLLAAFADIMAGDVKPFRLKNSSSSTYWYRSKFRKGSSNLISKHYYKKRKNRQKMQKESRLSNR